VAFKVFDAMRGKWLHQKDRADEYEQELAALKGRSCETCRHTGSTQNDECKYDHPAFSCSEWQACAEEEKPRFTTAELKRRLRSDGYNPAREDGGS
jgi:hypothetical protein